MSERHLFGLIVRTAGLLILLYGVSIVAWGLVGSVSWMLSEYSFDPVHYLVGGIIFLVIGSVVMIWSEKIVALAYGKQLPVNPPEAASPFPPPPPRG